MKRYLNTHLQINKMTQEFRTPTQQLLDQIASGERSVDDLSYEELVELRKRSSPFGTAIKMEGDTSKYYAYSVINLREDYIMKLMTTALIGFLYKANDEYGVPEGDYVHPVEEMDREEITRAYIQENLVNGKVKLRPEQKPGVGGGEHFTQEETTANKYRRMVVRDFLDSLFKFNPDKHVRSVYQRNKGDPERRKLKTSKKQEAYKKSSVQIVSTSTSATDPSSNAITTQKASTEDQLLEYDRMTTHMPPQDLYYKFDQYRNNNFDALRLATRDIYPDKPDYEYALIIYNDFPSEEARNDFINKHESDFTVSVRSCVQNRWTFQAAFRENMDKVQCGTTSTRILQEIIEAAESNQRLGRDMLQKRMQTKKRENEAENGPADKNFIDNYRKEQKARQKNVGVRDVTPSERAQMELERRYYTNNDIPSKDVEETPGSIEVQVWTHNVKGGKMDVSRILTAAEDVDPETAAMTSATSGQKK